MSKLNKCVWITINAAVFSSLFTVTNASAQALPCVQKLLDWNKRTGFNFVNFTAVSLHSPSNIASYTAGSSLINSTCLVRQIPPLSFTSCLKSKNWDKMLLSNKAFDINRPVFVRVDITPDSNFPVHIRTPSGAPYTFYPRCVGDLIVGDDQWHNHWTMAFKLGFQPPIILQ